MKPTEAKATLDLQKEVEEIQEIFKKSIFLELDKREAELQHLEKTSKCLEEFAEEFKKVCLHLLLKAIDLQS